MPEILSVNRAVIHILAAEIRNMSVHPTEEEPTV